MRSGWFLFVLLCSLLVFGGCLFSFSSCRDLDGDGFGNPASSSCLQSGLDCNDNDVGVFPGASEVCNNNRDDDCDFGVDEGCPSFFKTETWIEAENGSLNGSMLSSGGFVFSNVPNNGSVSYDFQVNSSEIYVIEVQVLSATAGQNSFFVGMDAESAFGVDAFIFDSVVSSSVASDFVNSRGPMGNATFTQFDPRKFNLSAGRHTLVFYGRESYTKLDKLRITRFNTSEPYCGDGTCNGNENCTSCPIDCNVCEQPVLVPVYFSSPSENEVFISGRPIYLRVDKLGSNQISRVEFWKGRQILHTDTSYPYEYFIENSTPGNYNIGLKAYSSGNVAVAEDFVSFSVKNQDSNPSYCMSNGKDECAEMLNYLNRFATSSWSYICNDAPDSMGWGEGFKLQGIASLYEAFPNKTYLDIMRADINVLFCIEDDIQSNDCAVCPFTYSGYGQNPGSVQKEWGWYGNGYSLVNTTYFDYFVGEGLLSRGILKFVEIVKSDPALQAEYGADADVYLEKVKNLYDKWDRRGLFMEVGDGSGVYVFHNDSHVHMGGRALMSLPHNQQDEWAGAMIALYRITGDVKYRDRAAKLLYHLKKNYYYENATLNWDYWNHAGLWDYTVKADAVPRGGLRHGEFEHSKCGYKRIETEPMVEGWMNCIVFDDSDMAGVRARNDIHSSVPNEYDYNCAYPAYVGFFDKSRLYRSFLKLDEMDDDVDPGELPWQSIYRLDANNFFSALKDPYPKYFVCNVKEIPIYQNFDGATTNFRAVPDVTSVGNVVLEKSRFGKIEFGSRSLDMANLFLDAYVDIGKGFVKIDGSELPVLDVPATISLYGVNSIDSVVIMKGSAVCSECVILQSGNNFKFTIPGAGIYRIENEKLLKFSDGFESGDLSKWPVKLDKGKIVVSSEKSRSGTKSMKVIFDGQVEMYVQTPVLNVKDYVYKVSVLFADDFTVNSKGIRFSLGHNATDKFGKNTIIFDNRLGADIAFNTSGSENHIYFEYTDDTGFKHWIPQNKMAGLVIQKGKWYDLEYYFRSDSSGSDGYADFFIDGKFIGRSVMGDTKKSVQRSFNLGVQPEQLWGGSVRGSMYFDNFEIFEMDENQ